MTRFSLAPRVGLALALLMVAPACTDLLTEQPKDRISTDAFFQTANDAKAAIAATYRPLSTGSLWGTNLQWALNAATDESRVGPEEENPNIVALTQLSWTTTNPYIAGSNASGGAWGGLYQMITRANLVLARVPAITMDETQKNQILAEAKFLRALGYFYLVRLYGDVPLVLTPEDQAALGPRTPSAQVFDQIVKDATEAEAVLPATWGSADKGRATKGSAEALLAEQYIWRKQWANAAAAAKKIIDGGNYGLQANYINAFLPGSQNRNEEVFAAQSSSATGAPAIDIAAWEYPRNMNPNSNGGWGTWQPLQTFIDGYQTGDYRKEVSFFTSGLDPSGKTVTFLPHVYKFRPTARPGQQDVNWPIYRYADVLLMYAEALNEQGQTAAAIPYVNMIRARARNGTGSEARTSPADLSAALDQAATRAAIFDERKWELAFEGKRWFDLVRQGFAVFQAAESTDLTVIPGNIKAERMLWPVPQAQIDLNKQLTQNPGY
ncbi:MAG TPA: RagB/SusD family nutrient uptake outer membrane protein [Gemmatimonadaceae bacterium]